MKTKGAFVIAILALIGILFLLPVAREELSWRTASSGDKAKNYAQYLSEWPHGRHASEAKSRYDARNWDETRAAGTLDAYQHFMQVNPTSSHLSDARGNIELLIWVKALNTGTIRGLQTYVDTYPAGRFMTYERWREAALRDDETPFAAALKEGTPQAMELFLAEFPGHSKEPDARRVLNEMTQGRDIVDLINDHKIEVEATGSGIQHVNIRLRRLVHEQITVSVPAGTFFDSGSGSEQSMVTTDDAKITLEDNEWQSLAPPAACANRPKNVPYENDTFRVRRSPHQAELARLIPMLEKAGVDYPTRQAAVWIVTDDANYDDLGELVESQIGRFDGTRIIHEVEAARAMKICADAGINMTRKAIWNDRPQILEGLNGTDDADIKKWLAGKR